MRCRVDGRLIVAAAGRALALLCALAAGLGAQQLRGRVVSAATQAPVAGALVELRDPAGRVLDTRLTTTAGTFVFLVAAPGTFQYRVAAIGFSARPPAPVTVPAEGLALPDLGLTPMALRLPDLMASGGRQYCGEASAGDAVLSRLMASAQNALEVIEATVRSGTIGFDVERIRSRILYRSVNNLEQADTSYAELAAWPIQSIEPDSLRVHGFMRESWDRDGAMKRTFYGPDARVLFSPWFMTGHCFSLAKVNPASSELKLHFKPARKSRGVDIEGVLTLDATTYALRTLEFSHVNLPRWMAERSAGGEMMFRQLPSGLWITTLWSIWGPIEGVNLDARSEMSGVAESRGRVIRLVQMGSADRPR